MKIIGIDFASGKRVSVENAKSSFSYQCPIYKAFGIEAKIFAVRRGSVDFFRYAPNFAHRPDILAEFNSKCGSGTESQQHLMAKNFLVKKLSLQGRTNVRPEVVFKNDNAWRVADVYAEYKETKQVFEVQISPISLPELIDRTRDYEEQFGIDDVIWVLNNQLSNLDELQKWLFRNNYKAGTISFEVEKKVIAEWVSE